MANGMTSLFAIGDTAKLVLVNTATRKSVSLNMLNSAEADLKSEAFFSMNGGKKSIQFNKAGEGKLVCKAEETSAYIRKEVLGLSYTPAEKGNGIKLFKSKEIVLKEGGVSDPIPEGEVPETGTMVVVSEDNEITYKLVTTEPKAGEYSYDTSTRVLKIGTGTVGQIVLLEGDILSETMTEMGFQSTSHAPVFEGYLYVFKTHSDGEVKKEIIKFPKLSPSKAIKITAESEKVSEQDLEFEVLLAKGEVDLAKFINEA